MNKDDKPSKGVIVGRAFQRAASTLLEALERDAVLGDKPGTRSCLLCNMDELTGVERHASDCAMSIARSVVAANATNAEAANRAVEGSEVVQ